MIISLNEQLISDLNKTTTTQEVLNIYAKYLPTKKIYFGFIENYDKANSFYSDKMKKDKAFNKFISDSKFAQGSNGIDFIALLAKPLQRIFSYKNFFDRLVSLVPKESYSFDKVNKLSQSAENLVRFIDDSKRTNDSIRKVCEIIPMNQIRESTTKRWRKYLKEGNLILSTNGKENIISECFLSTDTFFYRLNGKLPSIILAFTQLVYSIFLLNLKTS